MKFTFKPWKGGYLHILGNGNTIFYSPEQMKTIHECCHELEKRVAEHSFPASQDGE